MIYFSFNQNVYTIKCIAILKKTIFLNVHIIVAFVTYDCFDTYNFWTGNFKYNEI